MGRARFLCPATFCSKADSVSPRCAAALPPLLEARSSGPAFPPHHGAARALSGGAEWGGVTDLQAAPCRFGATRCAAATSAAPGMTCRADRTCRWRMRCGSTTCGIDGPPSGWPPWSGAVPARSSWLPPRRRACPEEEPSVRSLGSQRVMPPAKPPAREPLPLLPAGAPIAPRQPYRRRAPRTHREPRARRQSNKCRVRVHHGPRSSLSCASGSSRASVINFQGSRDASGERANLARFPHVPHIMTAPASQ